MTEILASLTLAALVELHNNLADHADKPEVKSFRTKAVAVARVEAIFAEANAVRAADGAPLLALEADGSLRCVAPVELEPAPVAATAAKAPRGPRFAPTDVIVLAVAANPKKATAADRFAHYRTGLTVAGYHAAVGCAVQGARDLNWDTKKAWVRVLPADAYAAEVAATQVPEVSSPEA